eukprot:TRINITY_DN80372_c0_g1_i1.p1 TRINITY_DN80372_c0_g1~~TRINITY_DN80372_c0_g1_i1.p1  ORF type:complete len:422 (-),score=52.73 TRINITY_DN80372_c0_g1_i1:408-1613(-)
MTQRALGNTSNVKELAEADIRDRTHEYEVEAAVPRTREKAKLVCGAFNHGRQLSAPSSVDSADSSSLLATCEGQRRRSSVSSESSTELSTASTDVSAAAHSSCSSGSFSPRLSSRPLLLSQRLADEEEHSNASSQQGQQRLPMLLANESGTPIFPGADPICNYGVHAGGPRLAALDSKIRRASDTGSGSMLDSHDSNVSIGMGDALPFEREETASFDEAEGAPISLPYDCWQEIDFEAARQAPDDVVVVNIYHVTKNRFVEGYNTIARRWDWGGVYHVGVQVYGQEWTFGLILEGSGVTSRAPLTEPDHEYYRSYALGRMIADRRETNNLIKELAPEWPGYKYHILRRNCCHFAEAVLLQLGMHGLPGWILRLGDDIDAMLTPFNCCMSAQCLPAVRVHST